MLVCQYFGRRHHTCLITVIKRNQHTHQRHQCLSAPHISLQKTVHLPARTQVPAYLLQHAFLSVRQLKRKIAGIKAVEYISHFLKNIPPVFALPVFGITQYVQLYIEQFLEFQAVLRFSQHIRTGRKMDIHQSIRQRHQMVLCQQGGRKRFGQRFVQLPDEAFHHLLDGVRVERASLHLLRRIVIGLQPHGRELQFGSRVYVRMRNVYPAVKHRRLAEYDIFLMNLVLSYQIFDALKPNQVDYPRTVREVSYQPPLPSFTRRFKA